MNNVVSIPKDSAFEFNEDKKQLLKNTICKGATDDELELFIHACKRNGLDPFMKQIYSVKRPERQKDGTYKDVMTIQTGIDGFRLIAERTGRYSPGREPTYSYDKDGKLLSSTAYIKKQTRDGTWHEVSATAFYSEYCQTTREGKPTRFWANMPHGQLAKCAEALALRKAFPAELSGVYSKEEMDQAGPPAITSEAPLQIEVVKEKPEEVAEILNNFLQAFPEEEHVKISEFMHKYSEHWKKTMKECVNEFEGNDKFFAMYEKWKGKQKKTHAA